MMTLTIEIPALDRLCVLLEGAERNGIAQAIEDEIVQKLEEAVKSGVPRPKFEEVPPADIAKSETAPEPRKAAQEPPKPEPTEKPTAPAAPEPAAKPVTLADVQKAAAQMRDDGKLEAVKALFPEFGIRKLSDLKGDALQGFAARLREMGATI